MHEVELPESNHVGQLPHLPLLAIRATSRSSHDVPRPRWYAHWRGLCTRTYVSTQYAWYVCHRLVRPPTISTQLGQDVELAIGTAATSPVEAGSKAARRGHQEICFSLVPSTKWQSRGRGDHGNSRTALTSPFSAPVFARFSFLQLLSAAERGYSRRPMRKTRHDHMWLSQHS